MRGRRRCLSAAPSCPSLRGAKRRSNPVPASRPPQAALDCFACARNDAFSRSRGAIFVRAPSFRPTMLLTASPAPCPGFHFVQSGLPKGEAERRETRNQHPRRAARGAPCGVRSPLGVPPRLLPGRQLVPKALHQAMLRKTVRGVRSCTAAPTGERRPCASPCMIRKSGCRFSGKIMHHSQVLPAPEKRTNKLSPYSEHLTRRS